MSKDHGPQYEMPKGISFENIDDFVFDENLKNENEKSFVDTEKKIKKNRADKPVKSHKSDAKPKKKHGAVIIAVIAAVALIAAVLIIVTRFDKTRIIPDIIKGNNVVTITEEDLIISFNGYDYAGTASIELQYEEVLPKIYECMGVDPENPGLAKQEQAYQLCDKYFFRVMNPSADGTGYADNLYNGQTVLIKMEYISDNQEEDEIIFKCDGVYAVCSGLMKSVEKDIFEDVKLVLRGENGGLTAFCYYIGELSTVSSVDFKVNGDNFSYGDEILVEIREDFADELYRNEGVILQRESCIFTAVQEPEYVVEIEDITEENVSYMIRSGIEKVEEWSKLSPTKIFISDMEYYGTFLYSISQYDNAALGIYNKAVIVYSAVAHNVDDSVTIPIYIPVIFEDIVNNVDGTQTVGNDISFRSNLHLDEELGAYICGYRDIEELLNASEPYTYCFTRDYTDSLVTKFYDEEIVYD